MMRADTTPLDLHSSIARVIDVQMFMAILMIAGIGMVMLTSTTIDIAYRIHADDFFYIKKQLVFLSLGLCCIFVVARIRLGMWERLGPLLLCLSIVLLFLVLIPGLGRTVNGSTRWLLVGPLGLQVSEFAKVAMIIYLSGYIVRHADRVETKLTAFLSPMLVLGLMMTLLMLEPDFGSAMVFMILVFGMLFLSGARLMPLVTLIIAFFGMMATLAITSPYRMQRIIAFMDPWADAQDSGYQLTQALIAVGNGGIAGVGIGESVQKLFHLPEAHNDFIFAVLAEEMGLIGVAILLLSYFIFIWRCFDLGNQAQLQQMRFAQNIAYGCGIWFGLQTVISLCVNMGMLPTKGLSLPFISVGGSNLLASCIAIGLLIRVHIEVSSQGAHKTRKRMMG
jgi:cell division protein FtsW